MREGSGNLSSEPDKNEKEENPRGGKGEQSPASPLNGNGAAVVLPVAVAVGPIVVPFPIARVGTVAVPVYSIIKGIARARVDRRVLIIAIVFPGDTIAIVILAVISDAVLIVIDLPAV